MFNNLLNWEHCNTILYLQIRAAHPEDNLSENLFQIASHWHNA